MRIISGTARGRQLANFSGSNIRPTPDRVREALFSILNSKLGTFSGLKILELFAGSGAQSLEAVSRGAQSAILVDSSKQAITIIEENIKRCKFEKQVQVIKQDACLALQRLGSDGPFDLILLDPPYDKGLIPQVLKTIETLQLLSEDGIICAESASHEVIEDCGRLKSTDCRKYGTSTIHLFSWNED